MPSITWLDPDTTRFPALNQALEDPDGLIAVGGDLSSERLLAAYRQGIFPWYEDPQPILWWSPDPRTVLFPDRIHISRSLRKALKKGGFQVSMDRDFSAVIGQCARLSATRTGTWITPDMSQAYRRLHQLGWAHSVEVWRDEQLIGGLYGVAIGKAFFGESMFSRAANGSKIAMVYLAGQLRAWGFGLIDCQVGNPHLSSMGAEEIPRAQFAELLGEYTAKQADEPGTWELDWTYGQD